MRGASIKNKNLYFEILGMRFEVKVSVRASRQPDLEGTRPQQTSSKIRA
jgi:hypothetical protein